MRFDIANFPLIGAKIAIFRETDIGEEVVFGSEISLLAFRAKPGRIRRIQRNFINPVV